MPKTDDRDQWGGARWAGQALHVFAQASVAVKTGTAWYLAFGPFVELTPGVELHPEGELHGALVCRVVDPAWPPGLRILFSYDDIGRLANAGPAGRVNMDTVLRCDHLRPTAGCRRCFHLAAQRKAEDAGVEWGTDAP